MPGIPRVSARQRRALGVPTMAHPVGVPVGDETPGASEFVASAAANVPVGVAIGSLQVTLAAPVTYPTFSVTTVVERDDTAVVEDERFRWRR